MSDFEIEAQLIQLRFNSICGVDEVGRGALFGPVVAAAVILDPARLHPQIDDSKRLSPAKRRELAAFIYRHARAYSIGWCWNDEIDRINILQASKKAMQMAVARLQIPPDYVLVDGLDPSFIGLPGRGIVKGDQKSMSIAAASILAKVFRDELMVGFAAHFAGYDFAENKGYPTKKHKSMLLSKGMTLFHRVTFTIRHEC